MTNETTQALWFHTYVRTLMTELTGETVEPDADGDFPVRGETATGWVRTEASGPWGVRVFVYAAYGVPTKLATLKEINEINLAEPLVKVLLHDNGVLLVSLRLLADAVNAENLGGAVANVLAVADRVGPLLVAVHGGRTPLPLDAEMVVGE